MGNESNGTYVRPIRPNCELGKASLPKKGDRVETVSFFVYYLYSKEYHGTDPIPISYAFIYLYVSVTWMWLVGPLIKESSTVPLQLFLSLYYVIFQTFFKTPFNFISMVDIGLSCQYLFMGVEGCFMWVWRMWGSSFYG